MNFKIIFLLHRRCINIIHKTLGNQKYLLNLTTIFQNFYNTFTVFCNANFGLYTENCLVASCSFFTRIYAFLIGGYSDICAVFLYFNFIQFYTSLFLPTRKSSPKVRNTVYVHLFLLAMVTYDSVLLLPAAVIATAEIILLVASRTLNPNPASNHVLWTLERYIAVCRIPAVLYICNIQYAFLQISSPYSEKTGNHCVSRTSILRIFVAFYPTNSKIHFFYCLLIKMYSNTFE